jgi:hypothetical protein
MASTVKDLVGVEGGNDIYVVGTGTSLRGFDFSKLRGHVTIALNDAILAMSHASYLLFCDRLWHRYDRLHRPHTSVVCRNGFGGSGLWGPCYSFEKAESVREATPGQLVVYATVAATGIHLATLLGARRILLLGVDAYRLETMRYWNGKARSNRKNYTVDEVHPHGVLVEKHHHRWIKVMRVVRDDLARNGNHYPGTWPGPGIYNLSELSRIDAFEKVAPERVFCKDSVKEA